MDTWGTSISALGLSSRNATRFEPTLRSVVARMPVRSVSSGVGVGAGVAVAVGMGVAVGELQAAPAMTTIARVAAPRKPCRALRDSAVKTSLSVPTVLLRTSQR